MVAPQEVPACGYGSDGVNLISVGDQYMLHEHADIYVIFQQEYPRHRRRTGPKASVGTGQRLSLISRFPAPKKATPEKFQPRPGGL
jgi:hypothetical protein